MTAAGQVVSGSPVAAGGSGTSPGFPLPTPNASGTIKADSAASLFHRANLARALQALRARMGGTADIALSAIHPGELDLVQDDSTGNLHAVRVALDDMVTIGPGGADANGPASCLSQRSRLI